MLVLSLLVGNNARVCHVLPVPLISVAWKGWGRGVWYLFLFAGGCVTALGQPSTSLGRTDCSQLGITRPTQRRQPHPLHSPLAIGWPRWRTSLVSLDGSSDCRSWTPASTFPDQPLPSPHFEASPACREVLEGKIPSTKSGMPAANHCRAHRHGLVPSNGRHWAKLSPPVTNAGRLSAPPHAARELRVSSRTLVRPHAQGWTRQDAACSPHEFSRSRNSAGPRLSVHTRSSGPLSPEPAKLRPTYTYTSILFYSRLVPALDRQDLDEGSRNNDHIMLCRLFCRSPVTRYNPPWRPPRRRTLDQGE
ncbi:hypothetical protein F4780DRAFT_269349 [Xylariomycetidae sp. FL0641]|nr:hypothetical protein F4780DRAFT_269349 [Xylariomycetidae sp. FL0641]